MITSGSPLPVGSLGEVARRAPRRRVRVRLQLPCPSPRSGSSPANGGHAEPFDLKWLIAAVNRSPVAISSNVWISAGRLRVSMNVGSSVESRMSWAADGVTVEGR